MLEFTGFVIRADLGEELTNPCVGKDNSAIASRSIDSMVEVLLWGSQNGITSGGI